MNWNWRSVAGALLLMFAGAVLALAGEHLMVLHHHTLHHGGSAVPSTDAIVATLDDVLHLTRAQHDSVTAILQRHHSAWKAIHRELSTSMDSVHEEVGHVLTQRQLNDFHVWLRDQGPQHR